MSICPVAAQAAVKQHGTVFFDYKMNPVQPAVGQWFCEYELVIPEEGDDFMRDGALVEYLGLSEKHILEGDKFVT